MSRKKSLKRPPVRFSIDGQVWEEVCKVGTTSYAVKICKKGNAFGAVERFY